MEVSSAPDCKSPLLALPAEIRLQIYSHVLPRQYLLVNLCPPKRTAEAVYGRSIVAGLLRQQASLVQTVRGNGLHLLIVCRAIRADILPILNAVTGRFHCEKCYAFFLKVMEPEVGVSLKWLRRVQIEIHIDRLAIAGPTQFLRPHDQAKLAMERLRKVTWQYYGRLDLMECEHWSLREIRPDAPGNGNGKAPSETQLSSMFDNIPESNSYWLATGLIRISKVDPR